MIFRKPYALLIKNFKKIHFILIILCGYIFYKHLQLYSFVKEYVDLEAYSKDLEPISNYANILVYFFILIVIVASILLVITLKRKEKPWKLYLIVVFEYIFMLIVFMMASSFFTNYDETTTVASVLVVRDLLFIASIPQYLVFIILFIRTTGLDLNKFSFAMDEEYLELDSSDREEVELSFEIDKNSIKRTWRKFKRNFNYFYLEHKFIVNTIAGIFFVILVGYSYYYFGVLHKSYKEGQVLKTSGYEITIKDAYISDKDYKGKIIDGDNYVTVSLDVVNKGSRRQMNVNRFHLINRNHDIISTSLYDNDFNDLGKPYAKREFLPNTKYSFILIFKADKELDFKKFTLYYQEYISTQETYLRKFKLKLKDLRTIMAETPAFLNKEVSLKTPNKKAKTLTFNSMELTDSTTYNMYICDVFSCYNKEEHLNADNANKIMRINFSAEDFTGQELIDFSTKYGTIKYKDSNDKIRELDVKNYLSKDYLSKALYLKVPNSIVQASEIYMEYTIRNNRYTFRLR